MLDGKGCDTLTILLSIIFRILFLQWTSLHYIAEGGYNGSCWQLSLWTLNLQVNEQRGQRTNEV